LAHGFWWLAMSLTLELEPLLNLGELLK